jgi:hypothetical protein
MPNCKENTSEPQKENSQFEHQLKKGWMLKYLLALDEMFSDRWDYWTQTVLAGKPLPEPISKIKQV